MLESLISRILFMPPKCTYTKDDPNFNGCYFEIETDDGLTIPCVHIRSPTPARYTMLYSHANADDLGRLVDFFIWLSKYLYVDIIGYDYPGYGLCKGTPSEESVKTSACKTLNYVIDVMGIHPSRIILYGHSLGSAVCVFLSVYTYKTRDCGVAGAILQSCFMSVYRILFDLRYSAKRDLFETIDIIQDIHCPVTFIHGIDDCTVPLSHPQRLFSMVPPNLRYKCLFVPNAGHNNIDFLCHPRSLFLDHFLDFLTFVYNRQIQNMSITNKTEKTYIIDD